MKRVLGCILLLVPVSVFAQSGSRQQGTIVRMRVTDCVESPHGFMAAMSGNKGEQVQQCAEYVLVSDKIVYVIDGKSSEHLLPLAEVTRFRFQKNEMLIRIDDQDKESRFHIKAMVMRAEWERSQLLEEAETNAAVTHHLAPTAMRDQQ